MITSLIATLILAGGVFVILREVKLHKRLSLQMALQYTELKLRVNRMERMRSYNRADATLGFVAYLVEQSKELTIGNSKGVDDIMALYNRYARAISLESSSKSYANLATIALNADKERGLAPTLKDEDELREKQG